MPRHRESALHAKRWSSSAAEYHSCPGPPGRYLPRELSQTRSTATALVWTMMRASVMLQPWADRIMESGGLQRNRNQWLLSRLWGRGTRGSFHIPCPPRPTSLSPCQLGIIDRSSLSISFTPYPVFKRPIFSLQMAGFAFLAGVSVPISESLRIQGFDQFR